MNLEQARFNMIEQQIRPWEVLDTQVLSLLAMVKRENFVPKIHRELAFADLEIPLPPHSHPSQCMLSPKVEARLLQDLAVQKHEKVLEIGAGSGYMAALLAHRAAQVISLEIEPSLATMARDNLQQAGIHNAQVLIADGAKPLGDAQLGGPFDVIVVSGSLAELPERLKASLAVGGRLAAACRRDQPLPPASQDRRIDSSRFGLCDGRLQLVDTQENEVERGTPFDLGGGRVATHQTRLGLLRLRHSKGRLAAIQD